MASASSNASAPLPTILLAQKLANAPLSLDSGKHIIEIDDVFQA